MPGKDEVKIRDISASGETKSRLVMSNRSPKSEPATEMDDAQAPEVDLTAVHRNVIEPLGKADDAPTGQENQEVPAEEPTAEQISEEPSPEQPTETQPADDRPADSIGDDNVDGDDDGDDSETGEKTAKQDPDKTAAEAARAERLATYEAMAASGKYYLPIKTSNERRWVTFLLIIIVILLAVVALDLLLDANILKINGFAPPTNFFG